MQCLEKCVQFAERRYKMKGYFCVCENPNEKFDISFQVREGVEDDIPEEQQELYLNAEKTCNIIKSLENTDENTKKKYFDKLLSLSQVGLVPEYAQTKASKLALEKLQEEIVLIEGKRIKNGYMKTLAIDALILAVITSIGVKLVDIYLHFSMVWSIWAVVMGALIGTWVSFGARKFEICFDDLASLEKDKMNPWMRLIFISVASVIFVLFMNAGIVEIKIGSIDTATAFENLEAAFIIGLVCGLVESRIGVNVYEKAVGLIGEQS